jgi:hypothetical protein
MGWDKKVCTRFVELCHRIKRQQDERASDGLEHWFQKRDRQSLVVAVGLLGANLVVLTLKPMMNWMIDS